MGKVFVARRVGALGGLYSVHVRSRTTPVAYLTLLVGVGLQYYNQYSVIRITPPLHLTHKVSHPLPRLAPLAHGCTHAHADTRHVTFDVFVRAQAKHNGGRNTTRRLLCPGDRCH